MGDLINSLDLRRPTAKAKNAVVKRSAFDAARASRLTSAWPLRPKNTDTEIRESLLTLRARSRHLGWNNDYGKRFLNLVKINVIGHNGIQLQSRARYPQGDLDEVGNQIVESAWKRFSKKGNCTANRKQSLLSFLNLAAVTLPTDGEVIIRRIKGFPNEFGFALHQYDPDFLDVDLNVNLSNGNQIRMGVEVDRWGAPVNYHFLTRHPYDWLFNRSTSPKKYEVVPASQITHFFIHERVNQTRGVPWMATPAKRLYHLDGYEEAELVAARVGASKMGFYKTPTGGEYDGAGDLDVEDDFDGPVGDEGVRQPTGEAEPGTFEELPSDWDFVSWNPEHPNAGFEAFCLAVLRGVASGLNVSYVALANDLRGVSYSSIRQGTLSDQDAWRMLQQLFIAEIMNDIFADWLEMAMITGAVNLPISKFDKFNAPVWQPRGWEWVDPLKEETAAEKAIKNATRTPQQIVSGRGGDFFDNVVAIRQAKDATEKANLKTPALHWWEEKTTKTGATNATAPA